MKEFFNSVRDIAREMSRRFGILSLPLFYLALVFLDISFRWVYAHTGETRLMSWKPMLFTASWALIIVSLISMLPRRGRRIAMGALGVFFSFLVVLHGVMFNVFGHFFSFADIGFAGDGARAFSWTYFRLPKKLLFIILLFLLAVAAAIVLAKRPKISGKRLWIRRGCALLIVPLCLLAIGRVHQKLSRNTLWVYHPFSEVEVYMNFTDVNRGMKLTGLYQYTVRNLMVSYGIGANSRSSAELTDIFESRELPGPNELTGSLEGKNLIMVMMESIDTWLAQPDYMPNLCRLMDEGVEFTDFYTPLFLTAATFNTEIITQTGMAPPPSGMSTGGYVTNAFPLSLAHLFAGEGCRVSSFHESGGQFYNRGLVHPNLGFEKYNSYVDMGIENNKLDSEMLNAFDKMVEGDRFFTFIITISGHGPYDKEQAVFFEGHIDAARAAVAKSGVTGTQNNMEEYTQAVAHAMETDKFIGGLMDRLEERGLLEDTAVLLYADHFGKYMSSREFLNQLKGVEAGTPELYHTPCVLVGAGLEPMKIDKVTCSLDVAPTIADLFGLDAPLNYYAGESMFAQGQGMIPFPNNGWYDGETYFDGSGTVDEDKTALAAELNQRVAASMDAMRTDYFKSWEK